MLKDEEDAIILYLFKNTSGLRLLCSKIFSDRGPIFRLCGWKRSYYFFLSSFGTWCHAHIPRSIAEMVTSAFINQLNARDRTRFPLFMRNLLNVLSKNYLMKAGCLYIVCLTKRYPKSLNTWVMKTVTSLLSYQRHATSMSSNGFVLDWDVSAHIFIQK